MMTFLISLHVMFCVLLIIVILIQAGRGGGLVEMLSGVESMFGTKTDALLTRTTTILSISFFITCLSLALLSAKQSRSLIRDTPIEKIAADRAIKEALLPEEQVAPAQESKEQQAAEETASELPEEKPVGEETGTTAE